MNSLNKTEQLIEDIRNSIAWGVYKPSEPIPSVRQMARQSGVSTYTVTQAYDHLVATGELESHHGIGYFIINSDVANTMPLSSDTTNFDAQKSRATNALNTDATNTPVSRLINQHVLDTSWLMGHLFHDQPVHRSSGSGLVKSEWMPDTDTIGRCSRQVLRQIGQFIYGYGSLQGFLGLREQFAVHLKADNITATPEQMLTTSGVSHAIELILRHLCQSGDTILVDDPCWYWIIGCAQQMGLNVIGVPRTKEGMDLKIFEECLATHQPKLYISNGRLHNPTSYSYSTKHLYKVLSILKQHNQNIEERLLRHELTIEGINQRNRADTQSNIAKCYLVEDDVFGHLIDEKDKEKLCFATLDGLEQVIYVNGVSKSLGGNFRVGIMACPKPLVEGMLRQKMLSVTACSELNERIVTQLWTDKSYKRHLRKLRSNMIEAHQQLFNWLLELGFIEDDNNYSTPSLFVWLDLGVDSAKLALDAYNSEWHIAPGHLFSANGNYTTYIRLNVAVITKEFLLWLRQYVDTELTK